MAEPEKDLIEKLDDIFWTIFSKAYANADEGESTTFSQMGMKEVISSPDLLAHLKKKHGLIEKQKIYQILLKHKPVVELGRETDEDFRKLSRYVVAVINDLEAI